MKAAETRGQTDRYLGQITKSRFAAGIELWERPNDEMSRKTQPVVDRLLVEHSTLASQIQVEKL